MLFLCIDVGTTCSKAQVFDEKGNILFYDARECPLTMMDENPYADIGLIKDTVFSLIKDASRVGPISSIAFSSFGESFVLLGEDDELLTYPMLYTDARGEKQAQMVSTLIGDETMYQIAGVMPNAMYSLYKLLWIKENQPEKYQKAQKACLIVDYFGYLLTGKCVIDYALAARTGVFDIRKKEYSLEILQQLGINACLFSKPMSTGSIVGTLNEEIAKELGLPQDCKLVLGSHDQVCATLGAGVYKSGQAADGMGTVECITAVFEGVPDNVEFGRMGYPIVPFVEDGLYCTYILNYSSGSLVNWYRKDILHGYKGDEESFFAYADKHMSSKPSDLLLLPYFGGAATPYQDNNATGAILGLTLQTKDIEIYQAILEGTSFEMKLNLDIAAAYGINIQNAVATGGGSNSDKWLQIKADITGLTLTTLRSSEGGLCGLAILQAEALGLVKDKKQGIEIYVQYKKVFTPTNEGQGNYRNKYQKYKNLYTTIKSLD